MQKKLFLLLPAFLLFLGIALFLFILNCPRFLTVQTPNDGQVRYRFPVKSGTVFTLRYIHSVTNREVEGTFSVTGKGKIKPLTTTFDSFGPGLPYLDSSVAYYKNAEAYTVIHDEPARDQISLFVSPLTRERIILGNFELDLSRFDENPMLVRLFAESKWNILFSEE